MLKEKFDRTLAVEVDRNTGIIYDEQELARMKRICEILSKIDFTETYKFHRSRTTEGTANWIYDMAEIKSWLEGQVTNLWIHGIRE